MAKLNWDAVDQRKVEHGISKVALYPRNRDGVAWSGVTAVSEKPKGGELTRLYADNIEYASFRSFDQFEGTIGAYLYPEEFGECDGSIKIADGVTVGQQKRRPFDLCYRTEVVTMSDSIYDHNYKLHLVYNLTAAPSERNYQTLNDSPDATEFSWDIQSMPFVVNGHKAASTIVIDSTAVDRIKLEALEDILYGRKGEPARMPDPDEVLKIIRRLDLHRVFLNILGSTGNWIWDTFNFREDTVPIAIDREAERHIYYEPAQGTQYIKPAIAYSLLSESDNGQRKYMVIVADTTSPSVYAENLKTQLPLQGEEIIRSGNTYYYTYTLYI